MSIIIVGGGITGAFSAYLLAKQGIKSTIINRPEANMASHINPGGINPLHGPGIPGIMEAFSLQAYHLHLQNWDEIRELSGIDFDGRIIKRLLLAFNDNEKKDLQENLPLYIKNQGFSAEWLEPDQVPLKDARVTALSVGGIFTTGNATVDAVKYTTALLKAAQALGASMIEDTVQSLAKTPKGYQLVCGGKIVDADTVIVCNGAHSKELFKTLGLSVPVKPIKGELLLMEMDPPLDFDITREKDGLYHFHDNIYWLGGTREDIGFDYSTPDANAELILDNVAKLVPGIRSYPVTGHHAAMRPGSPDGLPILGGFSQYPGLYIATGGGSKGMLWSAGMGQTIVNLLNGKADPAEIAFMSPERFTKGK